MASQSQSKDAQVLKLKDGRDLGYAVYGNPSSSSAPIIFYLHGFPGARVEAKLWLESSLSPVIDAQCIGIDRPGMGLSTFQPNRKMLDFPADLIELAEHLKAEKFHIIGVSGGAPYALACAKQIPKNKLISVALCSGLYPGSRDGMLWALRALLFVGYWAPTALMATLFDSKFGRPARDPDPQVTEDFLMVEMQGRPKEDLQCFENTELRTTIADSMRKAFEQGGMGPAWDFRLFSEWGFELAEIDGSHVTIWHGGKDVNTPILMADEASRSIKGCTLNVFNNETHMSLPYNHVEGILRDLLKL